MSSIDLFDLISSKSGFLTEKVKQIYNDLSRSLPNMTLEELKQKESLAISLESKNYIYSCYLYKLDKMQDSSWDLLKNYIDKFVFLIKNAPNFRDKIGKVLDYVLIRTIDSIEDCPNLLSICEKITEINKFYMLEVSLNSVSIKAYQIIMNEYIPFNESYDTCINSLSNLEKLLEFKLNISNIGYSIIGKALTFLSKQKGYFGDDPITEVDIKKEKAIIRILRKLSSLLEIDNPSYEKINSMYPENLENNSNLRFTNSESIRQKCREIISYEEIKKNSEHGRNYKNFKDAGISLIMYDGIYNEKNVFLKVYYENEEGKGNFDKAEKEIKYYKIFSQFRNQYSFIEYYGTCFYKDHNQVQNIFLVMQNVKNSLQDYLENRKAPIEEEKLKSMYEELVNSFKFMHEQGIYHLDIKPNNIMIDDNEKLYIIDFDVSVQDQIANTCPETINKRQGTMGYAHPNIQIMLNAMDATLLDYHKSDADIFSLGMTFLHMAILSEFRYNLNLDENKNLLNAAIEKVRYNWAKDLIATMLKSRNKGDIRWGDVENKLFGNKTVAYNP
ncbi:hypothetical protein SteCoe_37142 [Stentor coeruleus]|uniref:Protein kinase domain-containing protein n=1 Tax=Stentor coeruleus TaxID=5963 RepID=A0A1R2ANR5_9CILI|nr:hypothetical protein SteCoe_37142 [Stentor coeruleus]